MIGWASDHRGSKRDTEMMETPFRPYLSFCSSCCPSHRPAGQRDSTSPFPPLLLPSNHFPINTRGLLIKQLPSSNSNTLTRSARFLSPPPYPNKPNGGRKLATFFFSSFLSASRLKSRREREGSTWGRGGADLRPGRRIDFPSSFLFRSDLSWLSTSVSTCTEKNGGL